MTCIGTFSPSRVDSEREEGEIIDELDDLSDISSEEEFLLRQRLQVLENYNNVLERKKAKTYEIGNKQQDDFLTISEISEDELDDKYSHTGYKISKQKNEKSFQKKRKRAPELNGKLSKNKDKKKHHRSKKQLPIKVVSESSEESDDEYRNKRRKLANAVAVNKDKNDSSSLKARLKEMLNVCQEPELTKLGSLNTEETEIHSSKPDLQIIDIHVDLANVDNTQANATCDSKDDVIQNENKAEHMEISDLIDLCTDDEVNCKEAHDTVDAAKQVNKNIEVNSDEDLELLRQHALNTKITKNIPLPPLLTHEPQLKTHQSEDEDSDTAELRMICLKSALIKKAMERKKKQKLQKRLSQSSTLHDDLLIETNENCMKHDIGNNTDIESVDMDIGSDIDDKGKEIIDLNRNSNIPVDCSQQSNGVTILSVTSKPIISPIDDLDEDEDLLRAKLLTSLSKNLPNLVDPDMINNVDDLQKSLKLDSSSDNQPKLTVEEKKFIINLNESDSEGEHEATKNLTKMHMKLSEQVDFQQQLDLFLKSTRMQVESNKLPVVIQEPTMLPKPPEKFVPKAVNHLPKSEQIEYKNLVRKMAELEKMKQARLRSVNHLNKTSAKETLKPRNVSIEPPRHLHNLDEQIALSRKRIAEESSKILQLKEEATKLAQKYKIVATELRNITTAITLNKKQQKAAQIKLSKIRSQHQIFLKRSDTGDTRNILMSHFPPNKFASLNRLQKENNPSKDEYKNSQMLKSLRVSVTNDLNSEVSLPNPRLSVQVDVNSNKKTVKIPRDQVKDQLDINDQYENCTSIGNPQNDILQPGKHSNIENLQKEPEGQEANKTVAINDRLGIKINDNDYTSPLQALHGTMYFSRNSRKYACYNNQIYDFH